MLAADGFAAFCNLLFLLVAGLTLLISIAYIRHTGLEHGEYSALLLFSTLGMMIMASSLDLMTIFLGLETLSISLYILAGFLRGQLKSNESALKYLLLGAFASGFVLYGIALVYGPPGLSISGRWPRSWPWAGDQPDPARHRNGPPDRRIRFQGGRRPVSLLGAGRLRGRPDVGDGLHDRRHEGGGVRRVSPHPDDRPARAPARLEPDPLGSRRPDHDGRERGRHRADQRQADAGSQLHRARRVHSGGAGDGYQLGSGGSCSTWRRIFS
jgi:hypothetical protein